MKMLSAKLWPFCLGLSVWITLPSAYLVPQNKWEICERTVENITQISSTVTNYMLQLLYQFYFCRNPPKLLFRQVLGRIVFKILYDLFWTLQSFESQASKNVLRCTVMSQRLSLIARFMEPTWGPSGAGRTQVGPMLAPWTLLSTMHRSQSATSRIWVRSNPDLNAALIIAPIYARSHCIGPLHVKEYYVRQSCH